MRDNLYLPKRWLSPKRATLIMAIGGMLAVGCDSVNRPGQKPTGPSVTVIDADRVEGYWRQLGEQQRAFAAKMRDLERDAESPLVRLKKATAALEDFTDCLRSIPKDGVDPELTDFAGRAIQIIQVMARLVAKIDRLAQERQALRSEENPTSPEVEVLLLLLSNGPASRNPDNRDKSRRLDAKADGLQAEFDALQAASDKLDTEEEVLRRRLAERHGRSFPPLSPPRDSLRNTYSDAEIATLRGSWEDNAGERGRMLLKETHPTGQFRSAALESFNTSKDREGVITVIRCRWEGALTGSKYVTLFRAVVDKRKGLLELSVPQDTAVISIAAPNLLAAQAKLHDTIRTSH